MSKAPDMPQDLFDLYAEFGIAAETAQLLETETGNAILCSHALFVDVSRITDEQREAFQALIKDINRRTLGAALKHLKTIGTFDKELLEIISDGLELRNYLTHKFFRFHNFAIHSEEGRKAMALELKDIQQRLHHTLAALTGITQSLSQLAGVPDPSPEQLQTLKAKGRNKNV